MKSQLMKVIKDLLKNFLTKSAHLVQKSTRKSLSGIIKIKVQKIRFAVIGKMISRIEAFDLVNLL